MGQFMKKVALLAGLLIAWPLLAQNPPAQNPPAQNPPAQTPPGESSSQNPPAQNPPAQNPPALEKPQMEAPEEAPADTKPAAPKKNDTPPANVAKKTTEGEGKVVEEIIARVNNEIITRSELDKAKAQDADGARDQCSGRCTPEQLQMAVEDAEKYALRDLIDQSLLAQRGKDMDINVEDFKSNIRNHLLTQEVIRREVGSHINVSHDEMMKYYEDHKKDFIRP